MYTNEFILNNDLIDKNFYKIILENLVNGIWVTDKDDIIYYANRKMSIIAGVPLEKIVGINVLAEFDKKTQELFSTFYLEAKKNLEAVYYESILVTNFLGHETYQSGWLIPKIKKNKFDGIICTIDIVRDISDSTNIQNQVAHSQISFKNFIMKSDTAMIVTDKDGIVIFENPKAEKLLKISADELIGNLFGFAEVQNQITEINIIHKGKPEGVAELKTITTEWDGKSSHLIMLHDITDRKKNENKIKNAEASLRSIVENNVDAMLVINKNGNVKFVNTAAEILFGRKKEELIKEQFQFSAFPGKRTEIIVKHKDSEIITAEIRESEIMWEGETAFLASMRDITEHVEMRETLRSMALVDDLTGLYNRRGFSTLADQQFKLSNRTKRNMFLLFIDMDNMKQINDNFGHPEGDKALIDLAEILKESFRESDVLARVGGDEFSILAVEATNDSADILINRLHKNIELKNFKKEKKYNLSISIGLAHYDPDHICSPEELISSADKLMYIEKQKKKTGNFGGHL